MSSNGLTLDLVSSAEAGNNISPCNHPCQVVTTTTIIISLMVMMMMVVLMVMIAKTWEQYWEIRPRVVLILCSAVKTKAHKDDLNLDVIKWFPQDAFLTSFRYRCLHIWNSLVLLRSRNCLSSLFRGSEGKLVSFLQIFRRAAGATVWSRRKKPSFKFQFGPEIGFQLADLEIWINCNGGKISIEK